MLISVTRCIHKTEKRLQDLKQTVINQNLPKLTTNMWQRTKK